MRMNEANHFKICKVIWTKSVTCTPPIHKFPANIKGNIILPLNRKFDKGNQLNELFNIHVRHTCSFAAFICFECYIRSLYYSFVGHVQCHESRCELHVELYEARRRMNLYLLQELYTLISISLIIEMEPDSGNFSRQM